MRKFKFIRGIYTNENIFNSEETNECLFALDKEGKDVLFTAQNNKEFQERFVNLSSERLSELYTIRPSQFKVKAEKMNDDSYSFSYTLNDKVYDSPEDFPDDVKNAVATRLKNHTKASIIGNPSLIIPGESPVTTQVNFTFDNKSIFTRNLYFSVSGDVKEYTITKAKGSNVGIAYETDINKEVVYDKTLNNRAFNDGILQKEVSFYERYIAQYNIDVNRNTYNDLNVASYYNAEDGYMFVVGKVLLDKVEYKDDIDFYLYEYKDNYTFLELVDAETALTDQTILQGYVAYHNDCHPNKSCYGNIESNYIPAYEFLDGDYLQFNDHIKKENQNQYTYYRITTSNAYVLIGKCKVKDRGETIVKDYDKSFSSYFIIGESKDNSQKELRQLKNDDLTPDTYKIVYKTKEDHYHIIDDGVYEDDSVKTTYVTLSNEKTVPIAKGNAKISEDGRTVAPKQDTTTFHQIVMDALKITATETYSD